MKTKTIILLIGLLILVSGCTTQTQTITGGGQYYLSETKCQANEDLCTLGTPGLLNQETIYSGSDVFFSVVLRNNIEGQEANNVIVQLKNVGPFDIVEGYSSANYTDTVCELGIGLWQPHQIRFINNTPNPQFVDDYGLPFAQHKLDVMYPDEEIEFLWELRAPSYHEIADVAYEHGFEYEVSYDYQTGILQTVFAMSEDEFQRQLSLTGNEPTESGTTTGSIGALSITSEIDEPVRVQESEAQIPLKYEIRNQRTGTPSTPAMFLLQYPEGTDFLGAFNGPNSLEEYGYIDLQAGIDYYTSYNYNYTGSVCIPEDYDVYNEILEFADNGVNRFGDTLSESSCSVDFTPVSIGDLLAYVRDSFPDLIFEETSPRLVIKFLYPVDLVDETNFLYFPVDVVEEVEISKFYTFRLKTKYRYSIGGEDSILIVPNVATFESAQTTEIGLMWGDMRVFSDFTADDYTLSDDTLSMTNTNVGLTSTVKDLGDYEFLHIIGLESYEEADNIPCTNNDDCGDYYCNTDESICYTQETGGVAINIPKLYSMSVGYNTGERRTNKVLTSGTDYYQIPENQMLYFVNEYSYIGGEGPSTNRADLNVHTPPTSSTSNEDAQNKLIEFINQKSFFEVRNSYELLLSDSDKIGYNINYGLEVSDIPASMRILNYYDNETLFTKSWGDSELIGLFSSGVDTATNPTLMLYFFENDESTHFFTYNISIFDASEQVGGLVIDTTSLVEVLTNRFYDASLDNYPFTIQVPNDAHLKNTFDFVESNLRNDGELITCGTNFYNSKPIIVIDYRDEIREGPSYDPSSNAVDGSIVIGDFDTLSELNTAYSSVLGSRSTRDNGISLYKGVVNICS